MKIGPKSKILIFFVVIIIVAAVILILMLLSPSKNSNTQIETGSDSTSTDPNVITINPDGSNSFSYVAITNQDTIVAFDNVGRKLDLELNLKGWKNLSVSSDGKAVSVLGKQSQADNYDLGIYTFADKKFEFYTNFVNEKTGILSYIWKDATTIIFHQGEGVDEWLHKFSYPTKTEIVKIARNSDDLVSASSDGSFILYRTKGNGVYYILNSDGEIIWIENQSKLENGQTSLFDNIYFSGQADKLLLLRNLDDLPVPASFPVSYIPVQKNFAYYKSLVNDEIIVEIEPEPYANFTPVCAVSEDEFLGFDINASTSTLSVITFNIKNGEFILENELLFSPKFTGLNNFSCLNNTELLFSVIDSGITKWVITDVSRIKEIKFLENAKEVKPINIGD